LVKRRKSSGAGVLLIAVLVVIGIFGKAIEEYGTVLLWIGAAALVIWLVARSNRKRVAVSPPTLPPDEHGSASLMRRTPAFEEGKDIRITVQAGDWRSDYEPASSNGDEFWTSAERVAVRKNLALGGMIYFGTGLGAVGGGQPEPALVDPRLPIASGISECRARRMGYWPSYSSAAPEARASYLHWLSTGRSLSDADIGYVFLYFYGLERRALYDAKKSAAARADLPAIEAEVERLLSIYSKQGSFLHYANAFLDVIRAGRYPQRSYMTPPAAARPRFFPFSYKLALAQCANDQAPLPAEWAFAWLMADSTTRLRAPATRCPDYFKAQFIQRYREDNAEGLCLPRNRTRLKLLYQTASGSFRNATDQPRIELDLPDVSVLTAPLKKLQALADRTCDDLDGYSRLLAKHPEVGMSFDGLLELPFGLWPEKHRRPFEVARLNVAKTGLPVAIPLEKLQAWLPEPATLSKRNFQKLCGRIAEAGLGIEPDVRYGGATPTSGSRIVLFSDPASMNEPKPSARYEAAALTIQLAAAVASADGKPDDGDRIFLLERLETWLHLSEPEKARLHARLRLELSGAPRLTGLKRTIEALDKSARKAIGDFVVLVAQADAVITPAEIRTLERIFKLLLLDPAGLYAKLHVAATEPVAVVPAGVERVGHVIPTAPVDVVTRRLGLDPNKVSALQKDSERLAGILSKIFEQEDEAVITQLESSASEPGVGDPVESTLFGLDPATSGFARALLGRSQWTRAELEELAGDRGLMVDGTLETINDACFDAFQQPLTEGEDPVEINQAVLHEVME